MKRYKIHWRQCICGCRRKFPVRRKGRPRRYFEAACRLRVFHLRHSNVPPVAVGAH